jgi:exopolysaccharide production protein ExoZ
VVELPHFGAFGIDIFFVISGFIMSSILLRVDDRGVLASWRFLKRRIIRIFLIYWVFAFMELARLTRSYGYLETAYLPSFLPLPGLFPRFPMLVGVAWTMVFEMFFYYTLAALLLVTVRRAVPVSIALFCLAVLVGEVVHPQNSLWMTCRTRYCWSSSTAQSSPSPSSTLRSGGDLG